MGTPRDSALARVNDAARDIVAPTRRILARILNQVNLGRQAAMPGIPQPVAVDVLATFDKVWRHFGQPILPVQDPNHLFGQLTSLADVIGAIDSIYGKIQSALMLANSVFRDTPAPWFAPKVPAFTITDDRDAADPPQGPTWPNGIYIKPEYAPLTPNLQSEVIVHEFGHWVGNQIKQRIQDNYKPTESAYASRP